MSEQWEKGEALCSLGEERAVMATGTEGREKTRIIKEEDYPQPMNLQHPLSINFG